AGSCDGLIDFRLRSTSGDATDNLPVNNDGHTALIGEKIGKCQRLNAAFFYGVCRVLRWTLVKGRVPCLLLCPGDGIQRRAVCLFQKEKVSAFVHNTN